MLNEPSLSLVCIFDFDIDAVACFSGIQLSVIRDWTEYQQPYSPQMRLDRSISPSRICKPEGQWLTKSRLRTARRQNRKNRSVNNAQALRPLHETLGCNNRCRIVLPSHLTCHDDGISIPSPSQDRGKKGQTLTSPRSMMERRHGTPHRPRDLLIGLDARPRRGLISDYHPRRSRELRSPFGGRHRDLLVRLRGQPCGVNDGGSG